MRHKVAQLHGDQRAPVAITGGGGLAPDGGLLADQHEGFEALGQLSLPAAQLRLALSQLLGGGGHLFQGRAELSDGGGAHRPALPGRLPLNNIRSRSQRSAAGCRRRCTCCSLAASG